MAQFGVFRCRAGASTCPDGCSRVSDSSKQVVKEYTESREWQMSREDIPGMILEQNLILFAFIEI